MITHLQIQRWLRTSIGQTVWLLGVRMIRYHIPLDMQIPEGAYPLIDHPDCTEWLIRDTLE